MPATNIPTPAQVRAALKRLSHSQVVDLAKRSGLPFTTVWKIRSGTTTDPRLGTARKVMLHIAAAAKSA